MSPRRWRSALGDAVAAAFVYVILRRLDWASVEPVWRAVAVAPGVHLILWLPVTLAGALLFAAHRAPAPGRGPPSDPGAGPGAAPGVHASMTS